MSSIIHLLIFLVGLTWSIVKRVKFEKSKNDKPTDYVELYREYNTLMIIIFLALVIDKVIVVL